MFADRLNHSCLSQVALIKSFLNLAEYDIFTPKCSFGTSVQTAISLAGGQINGESFREEY